VAPKTDFLVFFGNVFIFEIFCFFILHESPIKLESGVEFGGQKSVRYP
jgi:hypothetical protein